MVRSIRPCDLIMALIWRGQPVILYTRLYAMYGCSKRVLAFLVSMFCVEVAILGVIVGMPPSTTVHGEFQISLTQFPRLNISLIKNLTICPSVAWISNWYWNTFPFSFILLRFSRNRTGFQGSITTHPEYLSVQTLIPRTSIGSRTTGRALWSLILPSFLWPCIERGPIGYTPINTI